MTAVNTMMVAEKSPTALKTIGEVAEQLNVATHVLRFWEGKFNQIRPQKRRGRRYYTPEDVKILTQIKSLLYGQGYTIRGVKKFLTENRRSAVVSDKVQPIPHEGDLFTRAEIHQSPANVNKDTVAKLKAIQEALMELRQVLKSELER